MKTPKKMGGLWKWLGAESAKGLKGAKNAPNLASANFTLWACRDMKQDSAISEKGKKMRLIDADALPYEKQVLSTDEEWCLKVADIEAAPAVDAVAVKALQKQLYREHSRVYGVDADFENRMGGYNPSSFTAGFIYALERMAGWAKSLEER